MIDLEHRCCTVIHNHVIRVFIANLNLLVPTKCDFESVCVPIEPSNRYMHAGTCMQACTKQSLVGKVEKHIHSVGLGSCFPRDVLRWLLVQPCGEIAKLDNLLPNQEIYLMGN